MSALGWSRQTQIENVYEKKIFQLVIVFLHDIRAYRIYTGRVYSILPNGVLLISLVYIKNALYALYASNAFYELMYSRTIKCRLSTESGTIDN